MTLIAQLKRDEGLRLMPYNDSQGFLTIGYGHNLRAKGISVASADKILRDDIADARAQVRAALPWTDTLNYARRGVVITMTFNMGLGGLLGFTKMLAALKAGDYATAANEMLDSLWATQVGARATRLAQQMRTGVWQ